MSANKLIFQKHQQMLATPTNNKLTPPIKLDQSLRQSQQSREPDHLRVSRTSSLERDSDCEQSKQSSRVRFDTDSQEIVNVQLKPRVRSLSKSLTRQYDDQSSANLSGEEDNSVNLQKSIP